MMDVKKLHKKLHRATNKNITFVIALFVFVKVFFHVLAPKEYSEMNFIREYWEILFRSIRYFLFVVFCLYVLFNKNKLIEIVTISCFGLFNLFMISREAYYLFNIEDYREATQDVFHTGNYVIAGIYIIMFIITKISTLKKHGSIYKKRIIVSSNFFNFFRNRISGNIKTSD